MYPIKFHCLIRVSFIFALLPLCSFLNTVETYDEKLHCSVPESRIFAFIDQNSRSCTCLAGYIVFHPESDSAVRNEQLLHPEEKIE